MKRMVFHIPVETVEENDEGEKILVDVVQGTTCPRTNKRILRKYLTAQGVPKNHHKRVLKELCLWSKEELSSE